MWRRFINCDSSQFIWGTAREIRIGWIRLPTFLNQTGRELGWGCVCVPPVGPVNARTGRSRGLGRGPLAEEHLLLCGLLHSHLYTLISWSVWTAHGTDAWRGKHTSVWGDAKHPLTRMSLSVRVSVKSFCRSFSPRPCLTSFNCKYLSLLPYILPTTDPENLVQNHFFKSYWLVVQGELHK